MAVSQEQLEFAQAHFTSLRTDLLKFKEIYESNPTPIQCIQKEKEYTIVDLAAIKEGTFDLYTTVQAIFDVSENYRMLFAQGKRDLVPKEVKEFMYKNPGDAVENATVDTLTILIKEPFFRCMDPNIPADSVTANRMRPSLYM